MPVVDVLIKFDTIPRLYAFTQITIHDSTHCVNHTHLVMYDIQKIK